MLREWDDTVVQAQWLFTCWQTGAQHNITTTVPRWIRERHRPVYTLVISINRHQLLTGKAVWIMYEHKSII